MTAREIIEMAVSQIGIKEQPANSNNVKYNTEYYGRTVSGSDYPWCCAFVWWVFKHCNASNLFYGGQKTAYCPTVENYYKKQGKWHTSGKVGDMVLFDFGGKGIAGHIGIVEKVNSDGSYTTIEGNTGSGNDANGGAVMRRTRYKSSIRGFARPDYSANIEFTEINVNYTGVVNATTLNIRLKPTTDSDVIGKHVKGDTVNISAKTDNGWYKVNYPNIGTGYISAEYVTVSQNSFTDTKEHYAEKHIDKLFNYNIVSGYGDNTFRPDNVITRGEFAVIVSNALEKACGYNLNSSSAFFDVSGHYSEIYICKLVSCGIVNGFEDGTFRPDESITRGQAAIMACNMLLYCGIEMKRCESYPDTVGHYAEKHINSLKAFGVVNGYEDGMFRPDENITRGQAAMYVANCLTVLGK